MNPGDASQRLAPAAGPKTQRQGQPGTTSQSSAICYVRQFHDGASLIVNTLYDSVFYVHIYISYPLFMKLVPKFKGSRFLKSIIHLFDICLVLD